MAVREKRVDNFTHNRVKQITQKIAGVVRSECVRRDMARCAERGRRFCKRAFAMLLSTIIILTSLTLYPAQEAQAAQE